MQPGKTIGGKYRLERELGQGGMGSVWQAEQLTLGRSVALKFLALGRDRESAEIGRQRFLREARLAASINHRVVVDILDFATTDDDVPYIVMELLQGVPMDAWIDGRPQIAEVLRIFELILAGLQAVHEGGIIHRDLKPGNVMILEDEEGPYPKLLDFGISRTAEGSAPSLATSSSGWLIGTPHYMSPEQARGLRDIDLRSDLYSVGVMLYETLTGKRPYDSEHAGDLLVSIISGSAIPFSGLRPDMDARIAELVEKAMVTDRHGRFQSAEEMRLAVRSAAATDNLRTRIPIRPPQNAIVTEDARPVGVEATGPEAAKTATSDPAATDASDDGAGQPLDVDCADQATGNAERDPSVDPQAATEDAATTNSTSQVRRSERPPTAPAAPGPDSNRTLQPVLRGIDENLALVSIGRVLLVVWRNETTLKGITDIHRSMRELAARYPTGIGLFTIVEAEAPMPERAERDALARLLRDFGPNLKASALVFEGQGFRAAAVRSVVVGLTLLAKQPYPHRVFDGPAIAATWLLAHFGADELDITPSAFVGRVNDARRLVDAA